MQRIVPLCGEQSLDLDEVLAITLVSKIAMVVRVPTRQVISNRLAVFATDASYFAGRLVVELALVVGSQIFDDARNQNKLHTC